MITSEARGAYALVPEPGERSKKPIAECFDFEEFVGRSDECTKGTRGTTTDQKLKRKAL